MADQIYNNVMKFINQKGLTRYKVEKSAGLGNGTIESWRKNNATLAKIEKVAKALDVSVEEILRA